MVIFCIAFNWLKPLKKKAAQLSAADSQTALLYFLLLLSSKATGRTRTGDLLITNQLRYRLRYSSIGIHLPKDERRPLPLQKPYFQMT